jgi:N6-adenosine-specific RNA methylase IME4
MSITTQLSECTENSFNIVYADPPWKYSQTVKAGVLKRKDGTLLYPSMSLKELEALGPEIQRVAKADAALLLWATMPLLPEALRLINAWGFTYKTCFVNWVKTTKDGSRPAFGVGYYTRSNAELCLLCVRGKIASYKRLLPLEEARGASSMSSVVYEEDSEVRPNFLQYLEDSSTPVLMTPRREHSRKPVIVREMITRLFGDIPRVELFAREPTAGWHVMGNDTQHFAQPVPQAVQTEQAQQAERKHKRARKQSF